MTTHALTYSELSEDQRQCVAYLFADSAFGVDPRAFVYETNKQGQVTGRTPSSPAAPGAKGGRRKPITSSIQIGREPEITREMKMKAGLALDQLAQNIAKQNILAQEEKVNA